MVSDVGDGIDTDVYAMVSLHLLHERTRNLILVKQPVVDRPEQLTCLVGSRK